MRSYAKDNNIRNMVWSWSAIECFLFLIPPLLTVVPFVPYIVAILPLSTDNIYLATKHLNRLDDFNMKFGGVVMILILMVWKKGALAEAILSAPKTDRIKINNIFLRSAVYLAFILIIGWFLRLVLYYFYLALGLRPVFMEFYYNDLWSLFIYVLFVPISEEIYYRFLLLYITDSFFGRTISVTLITLLFAMGHDYSVWGKLAVGLLGFGLAMLTIRYGSIWPAITAHSWYNGLNYIGWSIL